MVIVEAVGETGRELEAVRDPDALPQSLRRAAESVGVPRLAVPHPENAVLESIASHPNTPADLLARLAGPFAAAFCRNPVAPLVALEVPDFVEHLGPRGAALLLRQENAPAPLVALIAATDYDRVGPDWLLVSEDARLHIAGAGEADPQRWPEEVRAFWERHARTVEYAALREEYDELAALGVLHDWAAGPNGRALALRLRRASGPHPASMADPGPPPPEDPHPYVRLAAALSPWAPPEMRRYRAPQVRRILEEGRLAPPGFASPAYYESQARSLTETPCRDVESVLLLCRSVALAVRGEESPIPYYRRPPLVRFTEETRATGNAEGMNWSLEQYASSWVEILGRVIWTRPNDPVRWSSETADALQRYARDGNRFVRAAARARLGAL